MTHKHGRVDENQAEIVAALRAVGARVTSMADLGDGRADALVSFRGVWYVLEIKSDGGKLTPLEAKWIDAQQAPVCVVYSVDEALRAIGVI